MRWLGSIRPKTVLTAIQTRHPAPPPNSAILAQAGIQATPLPLDNIVHF